MARGVPPQRISIHPVKEGVYPIDEDEFVALCNDNKDIEDLDEEERKYYEDTVDVMHSINDIGQVYDVQAVLRGGPLLVSGYKRYLSCLYLNMDMQINYIDEDEIPKYILADEDPWFDGSKNEEFDYMFGENVFGDGQNGDTQKDTVEVNISTGLKNVLMDEYDSDDISEVLSDIINVYCRTNGIEHQV